MSERRLSKSKLKVSFSTIMKIRMTREMITRNRGLQSKDRKESQR